MTSRCPWRPWHPYPSVVASPPPCPKQQGPSTRGRQNPKKFIVAQKPLEACPSVTECVPPTLWEGEGWGEVGEGREGEGWEGVRWGERYSCVLGSICGQGSGKGPCRGGAGGTPVARAGTQQDTSHVYSGSAEGLCMHRCGVPLWAGAHPGAVCKSPVTLSAPGTRRGAWGRGLEGHC